MIIGAHVPIGGSLKNALKTGELLSCEAIQIFTSNPKGWSFKIRTEDEIKDFCVALKESPINSVWGHMIYLVNLASPNEYIHRNSINALISGVILAERACFSGVVTHIGSHGGDGEKIGLERVSEALKEVIEATPGETPILLETDAGSGNHLGYSFKQIGEIIKRVGSKRIKVCLDTCHVFAAGYDIRKKRGVNKMIQEFENDIGINRLALIHLNDSKTELGSKVDRHEIIGQGHIGLPGFSEIINHPKLQNIPGIVETPDIKGLSDELASVKILKSLRK